MKSLFSQSEIATFRDDTRGTRNVTHLNNAGAALMPDPVTEIQLDYIHRESEIGGYEVNKERLDDLNGIYPLSAKWLNCSQHNIAYTDSATTSWLRAFYSIPFQPGDQLLTSEIEYASNYLSYLHLARQKQIEVIPIPSDEYGRVDLNQLEDHLNNKVRLVAITHIPTNSGIINPVEEIGNLLNGTGIWYLIDACQSAGQVAIDVDAIGCDFLSVTGRKYLRGPRSSGLLYASDKALQETEPLTVDLHSAEWTANNNYEIHPNAGRYEQWEQNLSGKLGLAKAIEYYLDADPDRIHATLAHHGEELRKLLKTDPRISVHDPGGSQGGIVTFDTPSDPQSLQNSLSNLNFNVSVSPYSSTLIDMDKRGFGDLIRASVHYYNTRDELNAFADTVFELIEK